MCKSKILGKLMKINNINSNINFKGPLDGMATSILRTCDMNEMVNAVGLDIGAMVIPRAYYDTKKRNEYAGAETFIREASGTFINCLSAGLFAMGISKIASKHIEPDVKINPDSWYTKESLETLKKAWDKEQNLDGYLKNVFENISGHDGNEIKEFKNINWDKIEWIDEKRWDKINWKNNKYKNIQNNLKSEAGFIKTFGELITDKNITKDDKKSVFSIIEKRLVNALGVQRNIELNIDGSKLTENLENILRDVHDMGKDVLVNKTPKETEQIIKKITKVNNIKTFGAITTSCILGLTNQALNRKITEKRTGVKGFVGDVGYGAGSNSTESKKDNFLMLKRVGASAAMIGMIFATMKVKNFKEFANRLQFSGPVTGGNAIKTVYGATIVGRFLAADNGTELRESMTRDYLGFLNWLVFGGFAAKGVANMLDKGGKDLFNYSKKGKGVKHWLNDMSLKTHNEIASKGSEFAKKNMWKLNVAQASGIAYSAITLGILLPMLNAKITERKARRGVN